MKKHTLLATLMMVAGGIFAQTPDTSQAALDSIDAKFKMMKLKEISVSAPKPVYSMTGEVVNYNVENDETVAGLTAWDAIRNAPTVSMDEEGNITMRGSEQVEVWLNGQPTHMDGPMIKAFFEAMPADALARVEVIKNPSAKYMVADRHHILNIVTSARLRVKQLLVLGLSGNTRPYLSPWVSYVRNIDRWRFNIHVSGSQSHFRDQGSGDVVMTDNGDTTSRRTYTSRNRSNSYFGDLTFNIAYKIDSATDFSIGSFNMLQGRYGSVSVYDREQWDFRPDTAHYRYVDSSDMSMLLINGWTSASLKHHFRQKEHNISLDVTWNYLFSLTHLMEQRLIALAEGNTAALMLESYDHTRDNDWSRNTLALTVNYNRPVDSVRTLTLRLGGQPYGLSHQLRQVLELDPQSGLYVQGNPLLNSVADYYTRNAIAMASWRREWPRTTLTADLFARQMWLHIDQRGLFTDDTVCRFFSVEPSLSLTHRTESMHYLRFRYSLKRSHPLGSDLTTAPTYTEDGYSVGSRTVHPATTHNATLSWNKYHNKLGNMSVDAYADYTADGIESVTRSTTEPDPWLGRIVSYTIPMNVRDSYKYGFDANVTYRPAAWMNASLRGSLFREGYRVESDWTQRTSWKLTASLWTKIAKLVNLSANVNFGSPTLALFTEQQYALTAGLSASTTLLDNRLSINVRVSDLFDSNRYTRSVDAPGYASSSSSHSSQRYITFGVTYRLGRLDLQWQTRTGPAGQ